MNKRYCILFLLSVPVLSWSHESERQEIGRLESYEPIYLGYNKDDNDVGFLDFKLSMKYPLFHSGKPQTALSGFLPYPYFAFTGRFGQYLGTRESSPVISKRFNPELFGRYWLSPETEKTTGANYLDFIYGHESNGQSINTEASYRAKRHELIVRGEDPDFANDYISRGWDYISTRWTHNWQTPMVSRQMTSYIKLLYFLDDGLLQGKAEDYNSWENDPEGKSRDKTDGLEFMLRFDSAFDKGLIIGDKLFFSYTTGLKETFKYNTYQFEFAVDVGNLPLMLWLRHGYKSDLVDYYREVTSVGIGIEFLSM